MPRISKLYENPCWQELAKMKNTVIYKEGGAVN